MQCEEAIATATTLHVACGFQTTDGLLYGPTTWEMRYSLQNENDWTAVELDDQPFFDVTIPGLLPSADYRIQFRYTDDRGTSEWLYIDATTLDGASPAASGSSGGGITNIVPARQAAALINDTGSIVTPTTAPDQKVILNDFLDFLNGTGKKLLLKLGQVIYFMIGDQEHSATVKEVGTDYVILTLASTPQGVRLEIGQTGQYDVTADGKTDVKITLNGINNGVAELTFAQVYHTNMPELSTQAKTNNWLLVVIIAATGYVIIVVLKKRPARSQT